MTRPGKAGRDDVAVDVALQLRFARRFARSCGIRPEHLDDFVQDVAVTALKRIQEGAFLPSDPDKPLPDAVRAWLGGIVRLKAIDLERAVAVRRRVLAPGPTKEHPIDVDAHAIPSPEARFEAKKELAAIEQLKMRPRQREVVRLTALGYTAEEIGARMSLSPNTVATLLKRARAAYNKARTRT